MGRAPRERPMPAAPDTVLVRTARFSVLERRSLGEESTWDALTPDWGVWQLRRGHRFSNDDALLA
eukprot:CAMPEP_0119274372 /NCGR_PEP_ID=MMETSP1329-20130426/11965_1 /TAXON_ID=114041 /ORGANISM="Genus nov. species nov., Strain RCC1024" /LENGTH=64 /DNA_ID=CAMNT_0007274679 /DNA_START=6 /DNA_END=197 /DNA_ORIENTATION=+